MSKPTLNTTDPSLAQLFRDVLAAQSSTREAKNVTEDEDYVAHMWRMVRGLERRAMSNPAILPQVVELETRMREVANVAIAVNALSYRVDPFKGASMAECAATLKISKQSGGERAGIGIRLMNERIDAAGVVRFAERQREREIIKSAAQSTVVALADWRARKAA